MVYMRCQWRHQQTILFKGLWSISTVAEIVREGENRVWEFLRHYEELGTTTRRPGSSCLITPEIESIMEQQMMPDDESTAVQLFCILTERPLSFSSNKYWPFFFCACMCRRSTSYIWTELNQTKLQTESEPNLKGVASATAPNHNSTCVVVV